MMQKTQHGGSPDADRRETRRQSADDLFGTLDETIEILSQLLAYGASPRLSRRPTDRFQVLHFALRVFGDSALPFEREAIGRQLFDESADVVEQQAVLLRGTLSSFLGSSSPKYSATNYWSPIDGRRRTIINRPDPIDEHQRRRIAAYSYAFFQLTYGGMEQGLYSMVQWIAERARIKRTIRIAYANTPPSTHGDRYLLVPPEFCDALLKQSGIRDAIEERLIRSDVTTADIELRLRETLAMGSAYDLDSCPLGTRDLVRHFRQAAANFDSGWEGLSRGAATFLAGHYGSAIDDANTLFMLVTNVIAREFGASTYIYGVPVRVAGTCCVLATGTDEPLTDSQYMFLEFYARALFTDALYMDFQEVKQRVVATFGAIVGHKLAGPLGKLRHVLMDPLEHALAEDESLARCRGVLTAAAVKRSAWFFSQLGAASKAVQTFVAGRDLELIRVRQVAERTVQTMRELYDEIDFQCSAEADLWTRARPGLIEFCIEELSYNAARMFQHHRVPHPRIAIEVLRVTEQEVAAVWQAVKGRPPTHQETMGELRVSDNGVGIEEHLKPRVFEAGISGADSTGHGYGLYSIRQIVEEQLGGIAFEDGTAQGARFRLLFTIADPEEVEQL